MPRKAKEIAAVRLKSLPSGFHAVGGVAGLLLQVTPTGGRSWVLRTMIAGKRRAIGLGSFEHVGLADARKKAAELRLKIMDGIDPIEERRQTRARPTVKVLSFEEAASRLIEAKRPEWKNVKHAEQWAATLKTYASPVIGRTPVNQVALTHILDILSPIWTTKTETASRVRSRLESVLAWATVSGYRTGDNPARWKGNLDALLAKPGKVKRVVHHAALPVEAIPQFITQLRSRPGTAARALEFAILTAARSGEVRGATWSEIDGDVWIVPATRMKAGKEHRVPLAPAAVAILATLPRMAGSEYVFPSPTGKQLSDMSISAVMRRMEANAVPHGFRSTFRDWCSEHTAYPRDVAEMALAHTIGNKVEAAYRRGDLFNKRRAMMIDWANHIEGEKA